MNATSTTGTPTSGVPTSCAPTYSTEIDGRKIAVYDGLLPNDELLKLWSILNRAGFTRTEIARPDTAEHRHWATEIPIASLPSMPFLAPSMAAVQDFAPDKRYRPYRSYVNVAHYGDMLFTHTDCLPDAGELTALWYVCDRWDHEWGGETVFFDAHQDVRAAVSPKPGRLAIFDGALLHAGRPPNRICYVPRYTLALKLERI
jgi:SM-20-related protein